MPKRTRRAHRAGFEAKVALTAIKGERTLAELARLFGVHRGRITAWKARLQEGAAGVFGIGTAATGTAPVVDLKALPGQLGALALEKGFFIRRARQSRPAERKAMIGRGNIPPPTRQASLLRLSRSSSHHLPRPMPPARLAIRQRIDAPHLEQSGERRSRANHTARESME